MSSPTFRTPANHIPFDLGILDSALQDAANWAVLQETLDRLCREHPGHQQRAAVNAKLWLIGRGYATGIERQIKSDGSQGTSLGKLADHLRLHHEEVDRIITSLNSLVEPLGTEKLNRIVSAHGRFCQVIAPVLNRAEADGGITARSFVAKYLHFHCRAVPIFDSIAEDRAYRLFPWQPDFKVFPQPVEADQRYYDFAMRIWQLYQVLRGQRPDVTVRIVDAYLLSLPSSRTSSRA